jgi:hypothetical protein
MFDMEAKALKLEMQPEYKTEKHNLKFYLLTRNQEDPNFKHLVCPPVRLMMC